MFESSLNLSLDPYLSFFFNVRFFLLFWLGLLEDAYGESTRKRVDTKFYCRQRAGVIQQMVRKTQRGGNSILIQSAVTEQNYLIHGSSRIGPPLFYLFLLLPPYPSLLFFFQGW